MALLESAISGVAVTVIEQAINATGWAGDQIRGAYKDTQAKQKALAAAQNYVNRYEKRHCQVKVMPGLMKEPLPLEDIYTAVKLLDDKNIRYFAAIDDLEKTYREKGRRSFNDGETERLDGIEVANQEPLMMVLGGPGIGKSTFLRKIGLETLKTEGQIRNKRIPVLLELKEFRDETVDLKQKIAAEFEICGFPESAAFTEASLQQGKLLVLLDGLDEVPTRNLNRVIEHIEDFVDAHDQNVFVASCRIAAYRGNQGTCFQRFTDVTLAEFDDEQIQQFIRRWFRSELDQQAGTADKYWELLQKDENKATKELAQTPLLLTFLCLVYDRQQMLPTQRSTLYGKALDILLSDWAAQRRLEQDPIYEGFHSDLEKVLLAQIAYDSFERDQLFLLKEDITQRISKFLTDTLDAPKHLDGAAVLNAIEEQQGILVERATGIYSFSHLTLQEYLTAFHIKEERLEQEIIDNHLTDERWQEVFLLLAGLRGNQAIDLLQRIEAKSFMYVLPYIKLIDLIRWSDDSTKGSIETFKSLAKRAAATAIASAIASASDITSNSTSAIVSSRAIASNIASNINSTSAIAIVSDINIVSDIAKAIVSSRAIASNSNIVSNINIVSAIASTISMASVRASIIGFMAIFSAPSFIDLPTKLEKIEKSTPEASATDESWRNWANKLEALWFKALNLNKDALTFDYEEAKALKEYLYATELLLRCKDAAVRIPKQAWTNLEARLLFADWV